MKPRNHRKGRHLAFISLDGGPHHCMTCGARVGPTWQAKAAHAGALAVPKEGRDDA